MRIVVAGVIVMASVLAVLALWLTHHPSSPSSTPKLSLRGAIIPGGSLSIHGTDFPSGGKVTFTVDGQPATILASSSALHNLPATHMLASLAFGLSQGAHPSATETFISVGQNGAFDVTLRMDATWSGGSHSIVAREESSGRTAHLTITVPNEPTLVSCAGSTNTITKTLGPVNEGQKQMTSVPLVLCTAGSGEVNWSAKWDQKQATWLQLTQAGHLQAPLMLPLQVGASAVGLKAGLYNTEVTFSSQGGSTQILVHVTLIVRSTKTGNCLNASSQYLSFSATQGQSSPPSQAIKITNCSTTASWTASATTDDGAKWLIVSPTGGDAKVSNVSVTTSSTNLGVGIYTGQVTFKSGVTGIAVTNIMLTVAAANTSCIKTNPPSLSFIAVQGQNNPGLQIVTLANCGSSGSWSAAMGGAAWLSIDHAMGTLNTGGTQNISVSVSTANLVQGNYSGTITFTMQTSVGSQQTAVSIGLAILPPPTAPAHIVVSPSTLDFGSVQQGQSPSLQLTIQNTGGQGLNWSAATGGANWVSLNNTSGLVPANGQQQIQVTVNTSPLSVGVNSATVTITSNDLTTPAVSVSITVTVTAPPAQPQMQLSSTSLSFNSVCGSPQQQPITINNAGGGTLTWTVGSPTASWLMVTGATNGTQSGTLTFTVTPANNMYGSSYQTTVSITPSSGPVQTVTIDISVQCSGS